MSAASLAAYWLTNVYPKMTQRNNFLTDCLPIRAAPMPPTDTFYTAIGVGQAFWRSDWTKDAAWLMFAFGPNTDGHGHQDAGSFYLWKNGWKSVTANIYSRSGIHNDPGQQNVIRFVDGSGNTINVHYPPPAAPILASLENVAQWLIADVDLSPIYPAGSGIRWRRFLEFDGKYMLILDDVTPPTGGRAILQIQLSEQPVECGSVIKTPSLTVTLPGPAEEILAWREQQGNEWSNGWRVDVPVSGRVRATITLN